VSLKTEQLLEGILHQDRTDEQEERKKKCLRDLVF